MDFSVYLPGQSNTIMNAYLDDALNIFHGMIAVLKNYYQPVHLFTALSQVLVGREILWRRLKVAAKNLMENRRKELCIYMSAREYNKVLEDLYSDAPLSSRECYLIAFSLPP